MPAETTLDGKLLSLTVFDAIVYQLLKKCADGNIQAGVLLQCKECLWTGLRAPLERACRSKLQRERLQLSASTALESEIDELKCADLKTLRRRWRAFFRKRFPGHLPRHLIIGLLSYQIQAEWFGDLDPTEARYLAEAGKNEAPKGPDRFGAPKAGYQSGTVYVREHAGIEHRVVKTAGGFEWDKREFQSLSAVAFAITGTKWNGLRFFGVGTAGEVRRG